MPFLKRCWWALYSWRFQSPPANFIVSKYFLPVKNRRTDGFFENSGKYFRAIVDSIHHQALLVEVGWMTIRRVRTVLIWEQLPNAGAVEILHQLFQRPKMKRFSRKLFLHKTQEAVPDTDTKLSERCVAEMLPHFSVSVSGSSGLPQAMGEHWKLR